MKPIEQLDWAWMKRNLHETGFEKLVEKVNEVIDCVNQLQGPPEYQHVEAFDPEE